MKGIIEAYLKDTCKHYNKQTVFAIYDPNFPSRNLVDLCGDCKKVIKYHDSLLKRTVYKAYKTWYKS